MKPEIKHRHELLIEELQKQYPLAFKIIVALKEIDRMGEYEFDTMWERDLMKYRKLVSLLNSEQGVQGSDTTDAAQRTEP